MSITTRARANADTAHPTRATGTENESAYWGSTGEIILTPSMTQPETTERFKIVNSRCFIYRRPIMSTFCSRLSMAAGIFDRSTYLKPETIAPA